MNSNRKTVGITIVILGLLIIALVIYLFIINKPQTQEPEVVNNTPDGTGQLPSANEGEGGVNESTPGDKPRNYQQYDISQEETHQTNEIDLVKLAQAFAERFGSYSNYSNYSNFSDLKIFMTKSMQAWAQNYVADLKTQSQASDEYFGVSTKAVSSQVVEYTEGSDMAVIMVKTVRSENVSQLEDSKNYNQDIEITLKKVNNDWLVDSAYWQ